MTPPLPYFLGTGTSRSIKVMHHLERKISQFGSVSFSLGEKIITLWARCALNRLQGTTGYSPNPNDRIWYDSIIRLCFLLTVFYWITTEAKLTFRSLRRVNLA